jgi:hypothetical protein
MGIEPIRAAPQGLENAAYRDAPTAACDWRANFRVMRDNVGPRETTTPVTFDFRCRTPIHSLTAASNRTIRPPRGRAAPRYLPYSSMEIRCRR